MKGEKTLTDEDIRTVWRPDARTAGGIRAETDPDAVDADDDAVDDGAGADDAVDDADTKDTADDTDTADTADDDAVDEN